MKEYFIVSNSFAAPFFSDTDEHYIKGKNPKDAMTRFRKGYKHPAGLYAANLYLNADAYHKKKDPLFKWCSKEAENKQ